MGKMTLRGLPSHKTTARETVMFKEHILAFAVMNDITTLEEDN